MVPHVGCRTVTGKSKADYKSCTSVVAAGNPPARGARRKVGGLAENWAALPFFDVHRFCVLTVP